MRPLFHYGFSLPGRSHVQNGTPCQDAHTVRALSGGWVLAAVADGVGSAARSAEGAALAVASLGDFCAQNFPLTMSFDAEALPQLLQRGFAAAAAALEQAAFCAQLPLREFDTTLTAALYDGQQAVVGHCGDGGVIALQPDGQYRVLTSAQKGEAWNEVVPLRFGAQHWAFCREDAPVAGLLLLTDGLFDMAVPPLLTGCEPPVYTAFVHRFLHSGLAARPESAAVQELSAFIQSDACAAITDDVTAVVLLNAAQPAGQPPKGYLHEPDWEALRRAQYYRLYPHLQPKEAQDTPVPAEAEGDLPHDGREREE